MTIATEFSDPALVALVAKCKQRRLTRAEELWQTRITQQRLEISYDQVLEDPGDPYYQKAWRSPFQAAAPQSAVFKRLRNASAANGTVRITHAAVGCVRTRLRIYSLKLANVYVTCNPILWALCMG